MKKTAIILGCTALAMAFASCNKNSTAPEMKKGEQVQCCFHIGTPGVKSVGLESDKTGTDAEKAINTLQIFVFGSDGLIAGTASEEQTKTVTMKINSGEGYSFYAVANAESLSGISKVADLEATVTEVLGEENGGSQFAMSGSLTNRTVSAESKEFSIEVERRAAKVVLRKVTNSLPDGSGAITVEGIYLSNVATAANLFGAAMPEEPKWVNKFGAYADLSTYAWFTDKFETAVTVANKAAYETAHSFYAAPNTTALLDDDSEKEWCPRLTRLVLKTKIQDVDYYYPISFNKDLPELTANRYIDITNLNIKHLGSTDPDVLVSTDEVSISVTVKDWSKTEHDAEI